MKSPPLPLWRMPRSRYERLVDTGVFGPEDRIELLDGLLVVRQPPGERHATVVGLVRAALQKADYWVVNLIDEALEVYREPLHRSPGRGWNYDSVRGLRRNAVVTPLAAPRARIRVAALLP